MTSFLLFFSLIICALMQTMNISAECQPFGTRLAYGAYYSTQGNTQQPQINVMFNTLGNCTGYAYWGNLDTYQAYNCTSQFLPFNWFDAPYFNTTVYTCPITGIDYSQMILYTVTGVDSNNDSFIFLNKNISINLQDWNTQQTRNFIVIGDWNYMPLNTSIGWAPVTNCLNIMVQNSKQNIDAIIFTGDMAYDLANNNGTNYVQFLLMIQPYTSIWPFMATIGNHDQANSSDLTIFSTSFNYPYIDNNFYYNFTLGQTTFISFNPDAVVYFDSDGSEVLNNLTNELNYSLSNLKTQYAIPFSHFPFFCSLANITQCQTNNESLYPLQQLFANSGKVPMYISSHIHTYERSYPITLSGQVSNGDIYQYTQPQPPVYVIEGAAGNSNYLVTAPYPLQYFTASQVSGTGYGIMTITNNGDILYNHIIGLNCSIQDTFNIAPDQGAFNQGGFPIWLIVLLVVIGLLIIAGIGWFCHVHRKKNLDNLLQNQMLESYKNMQTNPNTSIN